MAQGIIQGISVWQKTQLFPDPRVRCWEVNGLLCSEEMLTASLDVGKEVREAKQYRALPALCDLFEGLN